MPYLVSMSMNVYKVHVLLQLVATILMEDLLVHVQLVGLSTLMAWVALISTSAQMVVIIVTKTPAALTSTVPSHVPVMVVSPVPEPRAAMIMSVITLMHVQPMPRAPTSTVDLNALARMALAEVLSAKISMNVTSERITATPMQFVTILMGHLNVAVLVVSPAMARVAVTLTSAMILTFAVPILSAPI